MAGVKLQKAPEFTPIQQGPTKLPAEAIIYLEKNEAI